MSAAPCLNCGGRYQVRMRCTEEQPAKNCTAPQLRPHVHVGCRKRGAEWPESRHQSREVPGTARAYHKRATFRPTVESKGVGYAESVVPPSEANNRCFLPKLLCATGPVIYWGCSYANGYR
jgi:hypothetical protein